MEKRKVVYAMVKLSVLKELYRFDSVDPIPASVKATTPAALSLDI